MDEKKERFIRVAENRTRKILDLINSFESFYKTGNSRNYDFSEEQVNKIFNAIQESIDIQKNNMLKHLMLDSRSLFSLEEGGEK